PGGQCPNCGDFMPENLVHCQSCRALLNDDLNEDSIEIPQFVPLRELPTIVRTDPRGYFVDCPDCHKELHINVKYLGAHVVCKFCDHPFKFNLDDENIVSNAFYANCPHCEKRIRASHK